MKSKFMISENIKRYKESKSLNNRQLARLFNISPVMVTNIINHGYSSIRVDTVTRMAQNMGISIESLLYKEISF